MSRLLYLASLACALLARSLLSAEPIKPTLDVNDMRVVVTYVSPGRLASLQAIYRRTRVDRRDLVQGHRHGFSILKINRETGAWTCEIYLPSASRPNKVDDEATLILGHEVLHCMLGDYHR